MTRLRLSETKDYFISGEKKLFFLADTVWSAFAKISYNEWEEYLDFRKRQNFNVLQINILHQSDDGRKGNELNSFNKNEDGSINFMSFNDEYFQKALRMLDTAVKKGFIPALTVLWGNYVKDTWQSKESPSLVMPFEAVGHYAEFVADTFGKYNPIFIISGDTDFGSEDTIKYYKTALDIIKKKCPDSLTTLHLAGCSSNLPEVFTYSENMDFYMYQSSHSIEGQYFAYKLALDFYNKPVKRPVINGEPCYEGHGYGFKYGKFTAFDVRKAMWQSLLSGAKAGITYGAHGIFSWHEKDIKYGGEAYAGIPFTWRSALRFDGAWDASYIKWLFELYDLFDIEPRPGIILNDTEEITASASADGRKVVVYAPYNTDIKVNISLEGYETVSVNLADRKVQIPDIETNNGISVIKMGDFISDSLIVSVKR